MHQPPYQHNHSCTFIITIQLSTDDCCLSTINDLSAIGRQPSASVNHRPPSHNAGCPTADSQSLLVICHPSAYLCPQHSANNLYQRLSFPPKGRPISISFLRLSYFSFVPCDKFAVVGSGTDWQKMSSKRHFMNFFWTTVFRRYANGYQREAVNWLLLYLSVRWPLLVPSWANQLRLKRQLYVGRSG